MSGFVRRLPRSAPQALGLPLVLAALALAGVSFAAHAEKGTPTVRGRLSGWDKLLPQVYVEATKADGHRYNWREPSPTVKQEFRKLSANVARDVCVVAITQNTAPAHEPIVVKVTGGRITPATIVVSPGSRLSFKNYDPFPHDLYEVGSAAWAANAVAAGSSREWSSSAVGTHVIRDQLFASVVLYVVVDPGALDYAMPDHDGAFSVPVPPGDYTIKAFFDGKVVGKESVHVGGGGLEIKEPIAVGGSDSK